MSAEAEEPQNSTETLVQLDKRKRVHSAAAEDVIEILDEDLAEHKSEVLNNTAPTVDVPNNSMPVAEPTEHKAEIPDEYLCPITGEQMRDPVIADDGTTYERSAIATWFEDHDTSPLTNLVLKTRKLIPNKNLKRLIEQYNPPFKKNKTRSAIEPNIVLASFNHNDYFYLYLPLDTTTISVVKEHVARLQNRKEWEVKLFHNDKKLSTDTGTLQAYEIKSGDEILFDLRPKTGLEVQIFIKTPWETTLTLSVGLSDTVETTKSLIFWQTGAIPEDQQRLIYAGQQLENDHSLESYRIQKQSTLHLVARIRGGCVASVVPSSFDRNNKWKVPDSIDEINALIAKLDGDNTLVPAPMANVLSNETCALLASRFENKTFTNMYELQDLMTCQKDRDLVETYNFAKIRTLHAENQHLAFHTDSAVHGTLQIFLNTEYENGNTIYLTKDAALSFPDLKAVGNGILHERFQVHGVSSLTSGSRKTLFLCKKVDLLHELTLMAQMLVLFYRKMIFPYSKWSREFRKEVKAHCKCLNTTRSKLMVFVRRVVKTNSCIDWQEHVNDYLVFIANATMMSEPQNDFVDLTWHAHLSQPRRYKSDLIEIRGGDMSIVNHIV